jgi:hypothetical protein
MRHVLLALLAPLVFAPSAAAQDPFEIQVYEWETVPKGRWNLETHLNFVGNGTKHPDGTVAATNHQFHLTFELTRGLTGHFETAGYLVLAKRPDSGLDFVGVRLRPRASVPKEWGWPVDVSLSLEFGYWREAYEENEWTLEVRPVLEKKFDRWQIDLNPVVGRALKGPGTADGWDFEPSARIAYEAADSLDLSVEYYGGIGPFGNVLPKTEQSHQIYPGGDWKISESVVLNFGLGFALTNGSADLVGKLRLGVLF